MTAATAGGPPAVLGLSHIALSVADLDAACEFWTTVMGFEVTTQEPSFCFLIQRATRIGLGLTNHEGSVGGPFDERRTGLDHLALAVADEAALRSWARRLDEFAVPHSPVTATDAGHHLNLRAPDRFPVELFAMSAATATAFGLHAPEEAVAATHE